MPSTIASYPDFEPQVRELVAQHRKLKKRVRLAVYYAPPKRAKRDIFLFEVVDGFGGDEVDPEKKLFEFGYGSTSGFPLPSEASLRVVMTSPKELHEAIRENWKSVQELAEAREAGQATVIYKDAVGERLWGLIA